jgi:ribosomal protein S18 acetylase RimI-like enzyme
MPEKTWPSSLLFIDPEARGQGMGNKLIEECIRLSKRNGYGKIRLWTQNNLLEARHLYKKTGFKITKKEANRSFGRDLVTEIWERPL